MSTALIRQRADAIREWLRTTDEPLGRLAHEAGFGSTFAFSPARGDGEWNPTLRTLIGAEEVWLKRVASSTSQGSFSARAECGQGTNMPANTLASNKDAA
jgi:hypothetical protein